MASNIKDPITAHFKFTQGIGRFSKLTNPNTRKAHEKDQREKAKLIGTDVVKDVGASEIAAQKAKTFADKITKIKQNIIAKPFKPKAFKPKVFKPAVANIFKPAVAPVHPIHQTSPINHNTPPNHSSFFNHYVNKFKPPKI